jgi:hypothetical protein
MATVNYTAQDQFQDINLYLWSALNITNTDGQPLAYHGTGDRTVQVDGTLGAGTLTLQGSNDPIGGAAPGNWFPLTASGGAAIALTTPGIKLVVECPAWIRPIVTGADGTTNLNVRLVVRRNKANG